MTHRNQAQHDAAYAKRQADAGIVKICLRIPRDRVAEAKALAVQWRAALGAVK